jgi:type II secretory pathway pseudopilin PulG
MRTRYAFVALVVLSLAIGAAAMLFTVSYYHREQGAQQRQAAQQAAAQARQAAQQQAAQRAQGELLEAKLCSTLGKLAALKPPAGNAVANPARGYDQSLHATLAQLGPDLGCPKGAA